MDGFRRVKTSAVTGNISPHWPRKAYWLTHETLQTEVLFSKTFLVIDNRPDYFLRHLSPIKAKYSNFGREILAAYGVIWHEMPIDVNYMNLFYSWYMSH